MSTWEDFEVDCNDYLKEKFGQYATFEHIGGPDSTKPDILVNTISGNSFYIEAKDTPAQCGQFVLKANSSKRIFEYSSGNDNPINIYAEQIIHHMNENFEIFCDPGTSGEDIFMENQDDIFSSWIIRAYSRKGVKFFITNEYTILRIEDFNFYFDVSAKYRIKRSGSREVSKKDLTKVKNSILSQNIKCERIIINNNKLFIESRDNLHNKRFFLDGVEYMYSARRNQFEVRRLSNTFNANVIFSITKKNNRRGLTSSEFISYLK